ncbi:MAG: hypothetical protein RMJ98_18740, partial [Myxococcales bacterium]|nr:hypothetical protein [Polyangiaceae bacterium]MDW8251338.1 hypothetical protein [Myxococcales bacterium]
MRFHGLVALGLGLFLSWGCQYIAGLEQRSERRAASEVGGEAGESGKGGEAGQGGAGTSAGQGGAGASSGKGGSFSGASGGGLGGMEEQAGSGGQQPVLARPPPRVGKPKKTGMSESRWFIVKNLDLGYRDGNGIPLKSGFGKKVGFDFDGKCTVLGDASSRSCKSEGNPLFSQEGFADGENCRDNLFGGSIFPAIGGLKPKFDWDLNYSVEYQGAQTLLFEIEDLDNGPNDAYAPANVYVAAKIYEGAPNWGEPQPRILDIESLDVIDQDGKTCVLQFNPSNNVATVPDGCEPKAKLRFDNGYVANNVWVSGPFDPAQGVVEQKEGSLWLGGVQIQAKLQAVLVTMNFFDDEHLSVTSGMYGAVISAEELKAALPGFLEKTCIPLSLFDTDIVSLVTALGDIRKDPPFHGDPKVLCDALTIGLGMTIVPSKLDGITIDGKFRPYVGK